MSEYPPLFLVTDVLEIGKKYKTPNKTHSAKSRPAQLPILPAFLLHKFPPNHPKLVTSIKNLNTQRCLRLGNISQCALKTDASRNTGEPADEGGRT